MQQLAASPKQDWGGDPTKPWGSLGGKAANGGVVLQLEREVGLIDDPVGAEDDYLSCLAGEVHLHDSAM